MNLKFKQKKKNATTPNQHFENYIAFQHTDSQIYIIFPTLHLFTNCCYFFSISLNNYKHTKNLCFKS
jgi:hypothetical protein